jgi:hypothetical protein
MSWQWTWHAKVANNRYTRTGGGAMARRLNWERVASEKRIAQRGFERVEDPVVDELERQNARVSVIAHGRLERTTRDGNPLVRCDTCMTQVRKHDLEEHRRHFHLKPKVEPRRSRSAEASTDTSGLPKRAQSAASTKRRRDTASPASPVIDKPFWMIRLETFLRTAKQEIAAQNVGTALVQIDGALTVLSRLATRSRR